MKFYWHPKTRSARVGWMLEEVGCDYEKVLIDIRDEDARGNADFRAADVMMGGSCHFMQQFGILPESRPIASYIDRCVQRPAFERGFV